MRKLLIPTVLLVIATVSLSVTTHIDTKNDLNLEDQEFQKKYMYESETNVQFDSVHNSVDLPAYENRIEFL